MKIITYTLVLLASIALFSSCNHFSKCEGYACVSPPPIPRFSIFNASGKNITDSTSFYIRSAGDDTKYKGTVVATPTAVIYWDILFTKAGNGVKDFELYINDTKLGNLLYETSVVKSECCSNSVIKTLNFNGNSILASQNQFGVYELKLK
ncbi:MULTISPECIES: hypothetical protein [Bacteroidota]|jgi:hypothetical protein|uniref:Lipoprotein n=1 Tax=Flectobacillus rivi TaxID=2984209 RepID=A0ABT6YYD1_9BACT|nr:MULTISPECIES: hypothetical protein [Bacteroidota]MDI9873874.1 hypothetical protein [Flectobacillus rivi]NBB31127.1 hypothetical protein [Cellulophaga sp. BC115SP]